ncbi:MAG: cation:dicarboxylase symporter family transporter [Clostridiales bacterium]|nr:cation:dicarboxylase symporter family transporter [Clostridiales bacterium]
MKPISKTVLLDNKNVDVLSEAIQKKMKEYGVQRQIIVRSRLALESILFDIARHYDEKQEITLSFGSRFGSRYISLSYGGDSYDPMQDSSSRKWSEILLSGIGLNPVWNYKNDHNEIYIRVPHNKLKDEMILLGSVIAAFVVGIVGNFIPDSITSAASDYFFEPVASLFMHMLTTFAGLVVFLSLLSGITGIGKLSDFSKIGRYLVGRYMLFNFLGCAFALAALLPLHSLNIGVSSGASRWKDVIDLIFNIVPSDPVKPFAEGNILQIVFMSVLIGISMLILAREIPVLHDLVAESNKVIMHTVETVCRLLPVYIFASLSSLILKNGLGVFKSVWKPFLFCIVITHSFMVLKLIVTSARLKVRPSVILKKIMPTYIIGVTTGSSMAAFGASFDINEKKLGIPSDLNRIGIPLGGIINCSAVSSGFVAVVYYLAELNGIEVSLSWFVSILIGITIVSCAMPPVSGGMLVGVGILLAQSGIDPSYIALAGTIVMFCDFFMTGTRIAIGHMELTLEADHWGRLDKEKLRSL